MYSQNPGWLAVRQPSPPAPLPPGEGSQKFRFPLSLRERGPGGEVAPLARDRLMDQMDDDDDLSVSALESTRASRARAAGVGRSLRQVWRASGVVALLALLAIVAVAVAPHLPRVAPSSVQIPSTGVQAPSDVATCLTGVSWSPDSRQIAAVESSPCGQPYLGPSGPSGPVAAQPNLLIFDATTGRQVATYALDSAVNVALTRVGLKLSSALSYDISYYETRWSPNGRQIAVGFGVYGEFGGDSGMAIVTLTGAHRGQVTVLLTAPNTALSYPTNGFDLTPVERWDVTNGAYTTIYLAPALAYRWLPSDVLVADQPLPANASAATPTTPTTTAGASDAGQLVSMWQMGTISPVTATACAGDGVTTQPLSQPYALLALSASAWSPDGRYLLDVNVQTRLATEPGRPLPASNDTSPCDGGPAPNQLPSVPLHDNGLRAALGLLDPYGNTQLTLAWSPDGRRLAVTTLAMAQGTGLLTVYDCASGAALQRFSGAQFEADAAQYSLAQNPVWSPDSAHLLLMIGRPDPKLLILGPQALDAR